MRFIMSLWSIRDNSSTSSIWPWLGSFGLWARENITQIFTHLRPAQKLNTQAQRLEFIPVLRQRFLAIGRRYVRGVVLKHIITWRSVLKNNNFKKKYNYTPKTDTHTSLVTITQAGTYSAVCVVSVSLCGWVQVHILSLATFIDTLTLEQKQQGQTSQLGQTDTEYLPTNSKIVNSCKIPLNESKEINIFWKL